MSIGLARWANRLLVFIQGMINCFGWIIGIALCALALGEGGSVVFLPFMLMLPIALIAVIVHEGGHYLAARSAGMVVLQVGIGRVELAPHGRRWRVRWARRRRFKAAGYVIAVHDHTRPMRAQSLRMIAGGPGANLATGAVFGMLAFPWLPHAVAWLLLAFAVLNVTLGLANLVPTSRGPGSDGFQLWRWRRPQREQGPEFAHARLLALTVSGVTADRLPPEQLAALDTQTAPMPLLAFWYRLKAQQNRGEWQQAAAGHARFEQLLQALPRTVQVGLADFLACIRTELAFSRALHEGDDSHLADDLLSKHAAWSAPTLWPRCLALRALLQGDQSGARRLLDQVQHLAGQSPDKALPSSEALIHDGMLARVAELTVSGGDRPA